MPVFTKGVVGHPTIYLVHRYMLHKILPGINPIIVYHHAVLNAEVIYPTRSILLAMCATP